MLFRRLASTVSNASPRTFQTSPTIKRLLEGSAVDEKVTVSGWIKSIRKQKNVTFAVISDGSSAKGLQAVFVGNGESLKALTNGAAVKLTGNLVQSPGAGQDKELLVKIAKENTPKSEEHGSVDLLGACDPEAYPIQKQALSTEYLRDNAHLRARTDHIAAMIRLRHKMKRSVDDFFENQGFYYTHTPILTGSDAEGAGEAFKISETAFFHPAEASSHPHGASPVSEKVASEFFGRSAFLTVSHQLHLESIATALSRVYTLSPCFRAEPSLTGRHLAEFWMLEAEWAFGNHEKSDVTSAEHICELVEGLLRSVVGNAIKEGKEMDTLWKGAAHEERRKALEEAIGSKDAWARMTYTEAIKELEAHHASSPATFQYEPKWGRTLQSEHEKWLAESLVKAPVFITDYPKALKPFYMRNNPAPSPDRETVACVDLIVPHVGELVGGSVREERLDLLEQALGPDSEAYQWYLDLRRYGGAPHAGFGMGFERLISWVSGVENVRECIPFPRWAGRMLL